ncbi:MAG: PVC-type heme-binding CxxCH protein [Verrucomicrobiaceae bacterium]
MKRLSNSLLCFLLGAASLTADEAPQVNTTVTSIEQQRKDGKRPIYLQPTEFKGQAPSTSLPIAPEQGESIVFIGNVLAERMLNFGHFESLVYANFPDAHITLRNMGYPAHTPAFRPEAGQPNPWAFPGAKEFRPEIKKHHGKGHYPMPDEWLRALEADTIVAFFGFNESFDGPDGIENFRAELTAFVDHTLSRSYNTKTPPKLVLATPIATENLEQFSLPDSSERNRILALYANTVKEVAASKKVGFIDLFTPSSQWSGETINGVHLGDSGYAKLAPVIFESLFGKAPSTQPSPLLVKAVNDKNWFWRHDYRIPNGVHVYGQRWNPYGNFNYPEEIEKIRQMTVLRDQNIWAIARGESSTLEVDDSKTRPLTPVETNYKPSVKNGALDYLEEQEALKKFTLPEGYKVETFATEKMFPNLANPMQMRFDNEGRLWVATMPSYPHYRPGDPRPNDMLLIYEDTDGDGRADKETVWADGLSIPIGFELTPQGVYVTEAPHLTLLKDTNGDGRADSKEYLVDGFDPHDSHHSISAFDIDNGGGIFMCEGRFLHSQVETPYGPQRMADGGAWRWDPYSWKLERVFQSDVSNPWGVAHDPYGQNVLNDASGGAHWWMGGYGIKMPHAAEMPKVAQFNYEHKIRPTSGSEFLYSRHFPDDVQGDYLYANTIGFLGIKQFKTNDQITEINGTFRQNLIESTDGNFRPADLELAPDGSLYFLDWHNALIGHMQHSARDPNRSSKYGRIYRITYPSRPLVTPPVIAGASITQLFENLKLPEINARKRSQRELRGRDAQEVIAAAHTFAKENASDERLVLEALWTTWGHHQPSLDLIEACLTAKDRRVRAAAVRVVRHSLHLLESPQSYLLQAAADPDPRVRIEALNGASWLGGKDGANILLTVAAQGHDKWINNSLNSAMQLQKPEVEALLASGEFDKNSIAELDLLLKGKLKAADAETDYITRSQKKKWHNDRTFQASFELGRTIFHKEGSCETCHQKDGKGIKDIYPPIASSDWVTGSEDRLTKLVLHGLMGPIEVNGVKYAGQVPMTAVGAMYNDKQVAGVLTYVRNCWGNAADPVTPETVKRIRRETKGRTQFYAPAELLKEHPFPKK